MENDIRIGDRFYRNLFSVRNGSSLPDYLTVIGIGEDFVMAQYENRGVGIRERIYSKANLLNDSNLNPYEENPGWIFLKNVES